MKTVQITGTGSALPERIVTNDDLAKLVDTSDEWIRQRVGIIERRMAQTGTVSSLAAQACENALSMAGKTAEEVDLIIVATCSPQELLPCAACQVQSKIGAESATAFDLNAACSGFLFALQTASAYIQAGLYQNALVVGSEVLSKLMDYQDRSTCILFGDGAGAVFVENKDAATFGDRQAGVLMPSFVQGANGAKGDVLSCREGRYEGHFVKMDGQEVYRFATRQVPSCILQSMEQMQMTADDIDLFLLHQANMRIIDSVAKHLKADRTKFPTNLEYRGNMSSAAIPVLLDELARAGRIKAGDRLMLSGFGAGLTYGACMVNWGFKA